ncbi:MAG: hypothetical protein AAGB35_09250 [Pseudomonadota bacterium]
MIKNDVQDVIKNRHHRQRQQYRCQSCHYQFINQTRKGYAIEQLYAIYAQGKQTRLELSSQIGYSRRYLWQKFDDVIVEPMYASPPLDPVNLIVDATFFGRADGVLVFRANREHLYWQFIQSETIDEMNRGVDQLGQMGYRFKSVTLDGKKGMIKRFQARYQGLPIQLCQFHQAQIIRRYLTFNPKTECGHYLKMIMKDFTSMPAHQFQNLIITWAEIYHDFLAERNEQGQFKHRRLRSARRSLFTNMPYLFTYQNDLIRAIPNTTNSCDGSFAHWKQKIKIHHGLKKHRRHKMINFLLSRFNLP